MADMTELESLDTADITKMGEDTMRRVLLALQRREYMRREHEAAIAREHEEVIKKAMREVILDVRAEERKQFDWVKFVRNIATSIIGEIDKRK